MSAVPPPVAVGSPAHRVGTITKLPGHDTSATVRARPADWREELMRSGAGLVENTNVSSIASSGVLAIGPCCSRGQP